MDKWLFFTSTLQEAFSRKMHDMKRLSLNEPSQTLQPRQGFAVFHEHFAGNRSIAGRFEGGTTEQAAACK